MQLLPQHLAEVVDYCRNQASRIDAEKRRTARVEVRSKAQISLLSKGMFTSHMSVILQDVSFMGVGMIGSVPVAKDAEFMVRLPRTGKEELLVVCVSRYTRELADGIYFVGAEYVRMMDAATVDQMKKVTKEELERIQSSVLG